MGHSPWDYFLMITICIQSGTTWLWVASPWEVQKMVWPSEFRWNLLPDTKVKPLRLLLVFLDVMWQYLSCKVCRTHLCYWRKEYSSWSCSFRCFFHLCLFIWTSIIYIICILYTLPPILRTLYFQYYHLFFF